MSVYVGIDVHRKRSQVAVIDQSGEVQKPAGHGRASKPGLAGSDATNAV